MLKRDEHTGIFECGLSSLHLFFFSVVENPLQSWWQKLLCVKRWLSGTIRGKIYGFAECENQNSRRRKSALMIRWILKYTLFKTGGSSWECLLGKLCFVWFYCVVFKFLALIIWQNFSCLNGCKWGSSSLLVERGRCSWNIWVLFLPSIFQVGQKCLCSFVYYSDVFQIFGCIYDGCTL